MERIEQKSDVLNRKIGRKGKLKVIAVNGETGVNSNTNVLSINKNLLSQWQTGEISDIDIDGTLAHELVT